MLMSSNDAPLGLPSDIKGKKSCQFLVLLQNAKLGSTLFFFTKRKRHGSFGMKL